MGVKGADSGGTLRDLDEVWAADSGGTLRKLVELWVAGEDGVLRNLMAVPVVSFCAASSSGSDVTVSWNTGAYCQSVTVELRDQATGDPVPGGGPDTVDTSPNTSGYSHVFNLVPDGLYDAIVTPYSGDNKAGNEGSPCSSSVSVYTGGGPDDPV